MSASVVEQVLARIAAVIAALPDFASVYRSHAYAISEDDLPCARVVRVATDIGIHSERLLRTTSTFEIDIFTAAANYETATDALHVAVDAALTADSALAALGRGLTCTATEIAVEAAEITIGKLTARYQIHVLTRPGDLAHAIN